MRWPLVRHHRLDAMTWDRDVEREANRLLVRDLTVVRRTLAVVSRERDHAHRLLRLLQEDHSLDWTPALARSVNCAVALESEGDIDQARRSVERLRQEVSS